MEIVSTLSAALSLDKYASCLSESEIVFMHKLCNNCPDVFSNIKITVNAIMADGKVDIFDVPKLICLFTQIYKDRVILYVVNNVRVTSLIRFTLDVLLDAGIIPVQDVSKDVIKKVVDASLDLLDTNTTTQTIKSCWHSLFRCGCTGCACCKGCKECE
jgi:hypothetical protein